MELIAKRPFLLGNRVVLEGERFETTAPHGNELIARGTAAARRAEPPPPKSVPVQAPNEGAEPTVQGQLQELTEKITPTPLSGELQQDEVEPAEDKPGEDKPAQAPRAKKAADPKKGA